MFRICKFEDKIFNISQSNNLIFTSNNLKLTQFKLLNNYLKPQQPQNKMTLTQLLSLI